MTFPHFDDPGFMNWDTLNLWLSFFLLNRILKCKTSSEMSQTRIVSRPLLIALPVLKLVDPKEDKRGVEPNTFLPQPLNIQNKQARSFCALEPQHQQHITLTQVVVRERGISVSNYGYFTLT